MLTGILLAAAILTEVMATVALKMSDGFTRLVPSSVVVVGYFTSFVLLAKLLTRDVSLGVVYAVWSAVGVALIVMVDVIWFGERLSTVQVFGLICLIAGVCALELGAA
ncbi:MAG: DMT family transporter [Nocardioidaceae bacterium]